MTRSSVPDQLDQLVALFDRQLGLRQSAMRVQCHHDSAKYKDSPYLNPMIGTRVPHGSSPSTGNLGQIVQVFSKSGPQLPV